MTNEIKSGDMFIHLPSKNYYVCEGRDEGYVWYIEPTIFEAQKFDDGDCQNVSVNGRHSEIASMVWGKLEYLPCLTLDGKRQTVIVIKDVWDLINELEKFVNVKLAQQKDHYEEQIAILSEQVPKGAVEFDKQSFEMKRNFDFKNEIVAALLKYENAKFKP